MAKILTAEELLEIVNNAEHEIDDKDQWCVFVRDIADVVVKHFGGERGGVGNTLDDGLGVTAAIHLNPDVPDGGGVYRKYDTDVVWHNGRESETKKKLTKKQLIAELKRRRKNAGDKCEKG